MSAPATKSPHIAKEIRQRILEGEFPARLPGVGVLSREFGVNDRTVTRALDVLEEEGMVRRESRRGTFVTRLKRKRTNVIGAVLGDASTPLGGKLVGGMQVAAAAVGQSLACNCYYRDLNSQMERVHDLVISRHVDGLVLWLSGEETERAAADYLLAEGIPFVMVPELNIERFRDCHAVTNDDSSAATDVMMHLIGRGRRSILFTALSDAVDSSHHRHRYAQYVRCMELAGLAAHPAEYFPWDEPIDATEAVAKLADADAVFCETDNMAAIVCRLCLREGIRVPDDLAVVGYDNTPVAEWLGLTSVEQHFDVMGHRSVELLLDEIEGRLDEPTHLTVKSELVLRGSTEAVGGVAAPSRLNADGRSSCKTRKSGGLNG
jgi:DNA-binding LacI/PurR family transcriptional regulator